MVAVAALSAVSLALVPAGTLPPEVRTPALILGTASALLGCALLGSGCPWVSASTLVGGLLLLTTTLGGAGWLPRELAVRLGLVAMLTVLPLGCLAYPRGWPVLVRRVAVPVVVAYGLVVAVAGALRLVGESGELVVPVLVLAAIWWRFEHAGPPERTALLWLTLGLISGFTLALPIGFLAEGPVGSSLSVAALLLIPACAAVGILAPNRYDVRSLCTTATTWAVSAMLAIATFSGLAAVVGWLTGRAPSLGVLALVALVPAVGLRLWMGRLEGVVDRLLFGERVGVADAASRFGERLAAADDPVAALRALREVLVLPYVGLGTAQGLLAASGTVPPAGSYRLPLRAGEAEVGWLDVGRRSGEAGPVGRERDVLGIVVPALGQVVQAQTLAAQLQESRGRVVTAVEDDRRRLRRDLHDGLGPSLTGVAYAADAAANLLRSDPDEAAQLLAGLRAETGRALGEVRRLVDGMGPAAVDELGLVPALRQWVASLHTAGGARLEVGFHVPDPLPELSAALEVVVFRVVTEALTNVSRHSGARWADVVLAVREGVLSVEITDDGPETPPESEPWQPGVGLSSMRERTELLGGTFRAGPAGRGGRVRATFPLG